jgi:hypothetical protein
VIAFNVLYVISILGNYQTREYRWIGLGAFLLFNAGTLWMAIGSKPTVPGRRDDEEMRSND